MERRPPPPHARRHDADGAHHGASLSALKAKVALSPRAQELKKAKELATPHGDINEAKVARLQNLIDEGKYKVDSEAVADRLVDEHFSMDS